MPPRLMIAGIQATTDPPNVSNYLASQWRSPTDILSVLLLLGPEIVQTAIAQLAGRAVTPVAFSFGWVTYSCSMLLSAIEGVQLMPDHKSNILVIDAESGHYRTTNSWVLCKMFDFMNDQIDKEMADEEPHTHQRKKSGQNQARSSGNGPRQPNVPSDKPRQDKQQTGRQHPRQKPWEALRITVYKVDRNAKLPQGIPSLDWVWFSSFAVILIQLVLSVLPWILNADWAPFLVTLSGNCLALCGASLPQWRREKWADRKMGGSTVTLTRGDGTRTAMVIVAEGEAGLDLGILARNSRTAVPSRTTRCATSALALSWILLLITVAGLKRHTWYLLGIGLLGSIQNLVAAGAGRNYDSLGVHIREDDVFAGKTVPESLRMVQEKYPTTFIGASLIDIFFPGGLRAKDDDLSFWKGVLDSWYSPDDKHGELVKKRV